MLPARYCVKQVRQTPFRLARMQQRVTARLQVQVTFGLGSRSPVGHDRAYVVDL